MASNVELARMLRELRDEVAALRKQGGAAPQSAAAPAEANSEPAADPEAPPATDVIKSLPPGGLQQWVEGMRPGDPKAWHYAKGIGRKFIGPKSEAALRWQLRGEDYTDALAKANQGRTDFEKSDPILSETVEQARNYGALGVGGGLAYLAFGSKGNKLPDNPNMGEIHGYIDRHDVPVSNREAPKATLVKEVRDWEKSQRPLSRVKNSLMSGASPATASLKGPGSFIPGMVANALMGGGGEPDEDLRKRMDFAPMVRRHQGDMWRDMTGESRRWNAKAIQAIDESKSDLQSRPGITGQEMLSAVVSRNPIGAFLSGVLMPTPAYGGELTTEDRARAESATPVESPAHARNTRTIINKVDREDDRLMRVDRGGVAGAREPSVALPQPAEGESAARFSPPFPLNQGSQTDPYANVGTPVDVVGQRQQTGTQDPYASIGTPVSVQKPLAWSDVPGEALRNAGKSAGEFVGNIAHAVTHPIETAGNIADVAAGGLRAGAKAVLPQSVFNAINSADNPETRDRIDTKARAVGGMLADRYGSAEGLKRTLANDPVGALADASAVLTGGGSIAARGPGVVAQAGRAVTAAGNAIDPLRQAGRVVARSGDAAANVLGVTTGAGTRPFREAFDAGRTGNQALIENMRGNVPVGDVVDMAENAVNQMSRQRSAAYNADMANVNSSRAIVDYDPLRRAIQQGIDEAHFAGIPIDNTAAAAAQEIGDIVNRFSTRRNAPGQPMVPLRTPSELDAAKRAIGEVVQRTQQGTLARRIAGNVYRVARDEITRQVPEYANAMENYTQASDLLQEMRRTMSINDRAMPDTTVRKLQSTMRNNVNTNYGARERLLDELARIEPNLPAALAGQSLNALAPRGLARAAGPIEAALAIMHNPMALAALPLSSPRLMGEVAHGAGQVARVGNRYLVPAGISPVNALMASRAANVASLPERAKEHHKKRR